MNWLEQFYLLPDFERDEHDYKLDLGQQLGAIADQLDDSPETWPAQLRATLHDKQNNITSWRINGPFLQWVDDDTAGARRALQALWRGEGPEVERFDAMVATLAGGVLDQPGQLLNMTSFLTMAIDPTQFPPVKIVPLQLAWKLAQFVGNVDHPTVGDTYRRALSFFDELVRAPREWTRPLATGSTRRARCGR